MRLALREAAGGRDTVPAATVEAPSWVEDLAEIANAIQAAPDSGDSILAANETTRARFDSLVYQVAADPVLTAAFEAARH